VHYDLEENRGESGYEPEHRGDDEQANGLEAAL
jgi:hypothetical protein